MTLECNVGLLDKKIRIAVGAIFLVLGIGAEVGMVARGIFFILAAVGLITGFARFCPLWALSGINTCKIGETK